jgi:hypothetical protein
MVDAVYQMLMLGNILLLAIEPNFGSNTSPGLEFNEICRYWTNSSLALSIAFCPSHISSYTNSEVSMYNTPFQKSNKQGTFRRFAENDSDYIGVASGEVKVGDQV